MLPPSPIALANGHGKPGTPKTTSIVTGNVNPADNSRKSPSPGTGGRHCSSPACSCRSPQMSPSLARSREQLKAGMKRKMQFAILEHPQCEDEAAANSGDSMDSVDDDNFCHMIQPGERVSVSFSCLARCNSTVWARCNSTVCVHHKVHTALRQASSRARLHTLPWQTRHVVKSVET